MSELRGDYNVRKSEHTEGERFHVYDANGEAVAVLYDVTTYNVFKNGLIGYGNVSMYNIDTGTFEVGDVAQLTAHMT